MTQSELKELLVYDPESGVLTWKARGSHWFKAVRHMRRWNAMFAGLPAGTINERGYRQLSIKRRTYRAHRLIWVLMTGDTPNEIDHINGNKSDNRFCNLRDVDRAGNCRNAGLRSDNTSGYPGVYLQHGKWLARIYKDGVRHQLGVYDEKSEAILVAKSFRREHSLTVRGV